MPIDLMGVPSAPYRGTSPLIRFVRGEAPPNAVSSPAVRVVSCAAAREAPRGSRRSITIIDYDYRLRVLKRGTNNQAL